MSDLFCVLAHSGICIEGTGRFKPCCKYQTWLDSDNAYQTSPQQLINHPTYQEIRSDLDKGLQHGGCHRCWQDEKNGLKSLRQTSNDKYRDLYEDKKPQARIADFGFGNTCNAACITCESSSSHLWSELDHHLAGLDNNKLRRLPFVPVKNTLEWSEPDIASVEHLIHAQNEVLASAEFLRFLQQMSESGDLSHKTILISTNGTIWPKPEILKILQKFKGCHIQISIDALGAENDYIRYPLKWSQVEKITRQWLQWGDEHKQKITMRATVSVFNILSIPQLKVWWDELSRGKRMGVGFCWFPEYLSPKIFGSTLAPAIQRSALTVAELTPLTKNPNDDPEAQTLFWDFVGKVDRFRGLSFAETFPDLFQMLTENKGRTLANQRNQNHIS